MDESPFKLYWIATDGRAYVATDRVVMFEMRDITLSYF